MLQTGRLRLRPPVQQDLEFVLDMYSRPEVVRYIGKGEVQTTREQAAARIERYGSLFGPASGVWLVERRARGAADPEPAGFALLKPIPLSDGVSGQQDETEIGWHLHPTAWGQGIASESAQALVEHACAQGLARLVAVTHPDNAASQAVARRLGMTYRGTTRRYYNTVCELFDLEL
ncbi:GNAT family N-acetyltransferase [Nesterenkonia sp.]|uniref:GNAT family N-acetyltransferase n=1 Tax=Nesterenkonia sp. TaxID=704201 RepID=UPI0026203A1B|nr:GNAT family N-acetyltransferase [Nesterenkonia sp.]